MSALTHCASPQSTPHRHTSPKPGAGARTSSVAHARRLPRTLAPERHALGDQPCHTLPFTGSHSAAPSLTPEPRHQLQHHSRESEAWGGQTLLAPRRAPRHPRALEFGRRWVSGASRAPSHLAAGTAARGAHSTARLLWLRSPSNRRHRQGCPQPLGPCLSGAAGPGQWRREGVPLAWGPGRGGVRPG